MNPNGTFDRDLERWLGAEAPMGAPAGLHEAIIDRARTTRQRPAWLVLLRGGTLPSPARTILRPGVRMTYLVVVLGLILALIAGAIFTGALRLHPVRLPAWTVTGGMVSPRQGATATLLRDGRVLVAGGAANDGAGSADAAELYDPRSGTWTATGRMVTPQFQGHTATLLLDGRVLVAGGMDVSDAAQLYDPRSGTWSATGRLGTPRYNHTAILLPDGKVLVAGGEHAVFPYGGLASAELYDPVSGTWTATGDMVTSHGRGVVAALLRDGRVLVAGGGGSKPNSGTFAELYDRGSGTWTATGTFDRGGFLSATLLLDGRVLAVANASAQLYNPGSGTWTTTGSMTTSLASTTATLLLDGRVLVAGGAGLDYAGTASAELYDPVSGAWTATAGMLAPHVLGTATLLPDGRVLVAGGAGSPPSAELYDPGSGTQGR
jgi:hypothetical protein